MIMLEIQPIIYKVYVKVDAQNRILAIDGGAGMANVDVNTWTLIDEGTEPLKYGNCQNNYLDKSTYAEHMIPRYKLVDGEAVERTQAEIDADIAAITIPAPLPTEEERLTAIEDAILGLKDKLRHVFGD